MRQAQLDAEARAREWEVEKMELASRFDFEQDEKKRLRRKATLDSGMESINNSDAPEKEKEIARFTLKSKYMDVEGYEDVLGVKPFYKETSKSELGAAIRELIGERTPSPTIPSPAAKTGTVLVRNNKGIYGTIPANQLEEAIANGYTVVDESQLFKTAPKPIRKTGEFGAETLGLYGGF
ncbi:hypothetical protein AMJ74_06350 [candidate division WOR_3 bacterium SM1_77]|uniref:Uncharacterized protein n=1 Tax=candidate division WOR_3 bacterium SM1_77 TaxID=1703778 RepID=A0A0S8JSH3_UNCW3|nr:MAG: hypothetical protein AMJ74_06350 [candidate division WOR_3 bacterium SM1_77]